MSAIQECMIGIVGGMGPQAGVALHQAIIRQTQAKVDQDHLSVVLMTFPGSIADRTAFLEGKTAINPAGAIINVVEKLLQVEVGVIGMPCNTSHAPEIFDPIEQAIRSKDKSVSLVHLPTEVIRYMKQAGVRSKRVGLMATNGTYKTGVYQELLRQNGYKAIVPTPEFQDKVIHRMIYDPEIGIKSDSTHITDEALTLWQRALDFFKEQQVNSIILGCTELSLIDFKGDEMDMQLIDSTEVLAAALIREATAPALTNEKHSAELVTASNHKSKKLSNEFNE